MGILYSIKINLAFYYRPSSIASLVTFHTHTVGAVHTLRDFSCEHRRRMLFHTLEVHRGVLHVPLHQGLNHRRVLLVFKNLLGLEGQESAGVHLRFTDSGAGFKVLDNAVHHNQDQSALQSTGAANLRCRRDSTQHEKRVSPEAIIMPR